MRLDLLIILVGVATTYGGPTDPNYFDGAPLYCDRDGTKLYSPHTEPWVAVDVSHYENGSVRCGDKLLIRFANGAELRALALDAGYLSRHWTVDYPHVPIVVDVPAHLAPFQGVTPARVLNLSALRRGFEQRRLERMELNGI